MRTPPSTQHDAPIDAGDRAPRTLVIVSSDYGEMGAAMYFLQGIDLPEPPVVLLPDMLLAAAPMRSGLRLVRYGALADIWREIETFRPDVVALFSGYLLTIAPPFSLLKALVLMHRLRRRGVPVLTSDPFLGLLTSPRSLDFTSVLPQSRTLVPLAARSVAVALRLYLLKRHLRGCLHVYPAPIERLHGAHAAGSGMQGFFNPALVPVVAGRSSAVPARWIFVLSNVDFQMQHQSLGDAFVPHLLDRLRDAKRLGRVPVLVGTGPLIAAVRGAMVPDDEVEMHADTSYDTFMALLVQAEYAFFWNQYSFSLLHRVLRHQPAMFFDEGHMVRILPPLHDAGVRLFYDGWRPPLLAIDRALDATQLASMADDTHNNFVRIAEGMRQARTPLSLLRAAASAYQPHVADTPARRA